ncbi:metal ABC transporter solute-binding protein, Zn/Mn family [Paenibacillus daejeonensis]|uniref:metal ABC transporter solute-binding protein, Zn/Mn family n=1 Tax=Paenibacillus daejeonensis TaxID=135193 RepID=UPI0003808084|nr:zinc ABC transporter substrate-binding protein [Paenibacillus daejeonensis]
MNKRNLFGKQTKMAFLGLVLPALVLSGCGSNNNTNETVNGNDAGTGTEVTAEKIQVVTSIYPVYFMAKEIGGDHADVVNLIPAGVEPHDWTPGSADLMRATQADLFLYNGAGLEGWVDQFLKGLNADATVVTAEMSEGIKLIEGGAHDHSHEGDDHAHEDDHSHEGDDHAHEDDHSHEGDDHAHEDDHSHEGDDHAHEDDHSHDGHNHDHGGVDPHTWVSPKSALIMAENVKDKFLEVDPANSEAYEANFNELNAKLTALDQQFTEQLATTTRKEIVTSHQAFGYLSRDYGLTETSIMGLSPDAEPRAQDLKNITTFVEEHDVKYIFFEELISPQLAQTLANEAKIDTLVLNPVEGLTPEQEARGEDFISLMEANLQNLMKALQ